MSNAPHTGVSFACAPVTCTAGPSRQCTSASGTQSFQLKTTAAVGDAADGGVIACLGGGLNNLVAGSLDSAQAFNPGIVWGGARTAIGATEQIQRDDRFSHVRNARFSRTADILNKIKSEPNLFLKY